MSDRETGNGMEIERVAVCPESGECCGHCLPGGTAHAHCLAAQAKTLCASLGHLPFEPALIAGYRYCPRCLHVECCEAVS